MDVVAITAPPLDPSQNPGTRWVEAVAGLDDVTAQVHGTRAIDVHPKHSPSRLQFSVGLRRDKSHLTNGTEQDHLITDSWGNCHMNCGNACR